MKEVQAAGARAFMPRVRPAEPNYGHQSQTMQLPAVPEHWFRGITFLERGYVYFTKFQKIKKNMRLDRNNVRNVEYNLKF